MEAYKRVVSRAGRWRWQRFDQAYSNSFAHGKPGGDVSDSGVAGVQRQAKIDDTGFIGQETFNLFRSIRIPEGLAHAGEPAMDATAVNLINRAWERFQGRPLAEPETGSSARARLTKATSQLGVKESPPNSNKCMYTTWYDMVGPWCAMFVTWSDQTSKNPSPSFLRSVRYAYVPYIVDDARQGKYGLTITSNPQPGDLVCYDWDWQGEFDHVGIVETAPNGSGDFTAIEGNTSTSNQSDGGEVMRRERNRYGQNTVFVRVSEA